jgi:peptide/nickel transport system permease protein
MTEVVALMPMRKADSIAIRRPSRPLRRLWQSRPGVAGALIIILVISTALFSPILAPYEPENMNLLARLTPPAFVKGGSMTHPLGTDALGRDILSRIIYGSRISLVVGSLAVTLGMSIGVALGLIAGYYGGAIDTVLSWLINVQLAFPFTLLAIFVIAAFGGGLANLIVVLAIGAWVRYARIMRGQVLSVKQKDYIDAAHAVGVPTPRILARYILPNAISPIIVVASFTMAETILAEAALSFLGLGIDPTIPSWGSMLNDGRGFLQDAWWIATMPGLAIVLTTLGINLFGDWLRDYLDPRLKV